MSNEASLFRLYRTQETKKKHAEEDKRIYYEVSKFINKTLNGGNPILDRLPPPEEAQIFERIVNDKSASAITLTYKPIFRDSFNEEQLRYQMIYTLECLAFNRDIPYEIVLIPDMDNNGNFHYHGVIIIPLKYRAIFKKDITKYIGFMKFDYIKDIEGWKKYCYKPDVYTQDEINKLQIYAFSGMTKPVV